MVYKKNIKSVAKFKNPDKAEAFYHKITKIINPLLEGSSDSNEVRKWSELNKKLATKLVDLIEFQETEVEELFSEFTTDIKQNYKPEFIKGILSAFSDKNYRIHATSCVADKIMEEGLKVSSDDIGHTSYAFADFTDNEILFELFNKMHRHQKQIMIIDASSEDLIPVEGSENFSKHTILPSERIKGYVDIDKQTVVFNPKFIPLNHVSDREVKKENVEITEEPYYNYIEGELRGLSLYKLETYEDLDEINRKVSDIISGILSIGWGGKSIEGITSKEQLDKLKYIVSQLNGDIKRVCKRLDKQAELERQKKISQAEPVVAQSDISMDDTDLLF